MRHAPVQSNLCRALSCLLGHPRKDMLSVIALNVGQTESKRTERYHSNLVNLTIGQQPIFNRAIHKAVTYLVGNNAILRQSLLSLSKLAPGEITDADIPDLAHLHEL